MWAHVGNLQPIYLNHTLGTSVLYIWTHTSTLLVLWIWSCASDPMCLWIWSYASRNALLLGERRSSASRCATHAHSRSNARSRRAMHAACVASCSAAVHAGTRAACVLVVDIDLCQLGLRVVKTADQRVDQHADVVVEDVVVLARVEEAGPVEYQLRS